mmetsp:Transcript_13226/g.41382  ORF Transcript_13226/g.41382 Transcript_13226/m.41382 type:complete len:297 (-) Transcript_13226:1934-2824(-)
MPRLHAHSCLPCRACWAARSRSRLWVARARTAVSASSRSRPSRWRCRVWTTFTTASRRTCAASCSRATTPTSVRSAAARCRRSSACACATRLTRCCYTSAASTSTTKQCSASSSAAASLSPWTWTWSPTPPRALRAPTRASRRLAAGRARMWTWIRATVVRGKTAAASTNTLSRAWSSTAAPPSRGTTTRSPRIARVGSGSSSTTRAWRPTISPTLRPIASAASPRLRAAAPLRWTASTDLIAPTCLSTKRLPLRRAGRTQAPAASRHRHPPRRRDQWPSSQLARRPQRRQWRPLR